MDGLRKAGGIAALAHSGGYLFGIAMYFAVLAPILAADPQIYIQTMAGNLPVLYTWIFVAYWVSAFALILVILELFNRLQGWKNWMVQLSSVLGVVWAALIIGSGNLMLSNFVHLADAGGFSAEDSRVLVNSLKFVENGIVSGNEFIGGLWVFFLCVVGLRSGGLQKALCIFGLFIGAAGILSMIPPLTEMGTMAFGFLIIPWFIWLGVVILRREKKAE